MAKIMIIAGYGPSLLNFRRELIEEWLKKRHEVIAVAPLMANKNELTAMGVSCHEISLNRKSFKPHKDLRVFFEVKRLLTSQKPDILFLYTIKPVIYGSWAAYLNRRIRVYSIITGLGYVFSDSVNERSPLRQLVTFMYRLAIKRNDKVFFQNCDDRADFIRMNVIEDNKAVRVNGSGVNLKHFQPSNIPEGPISFLMIARLIREKGVIEYIEAARLIKKMYPLTRFMLLGIYDTGDNAIDKRNIDDWTKEGTIAFIERIEDVRPVISASQVYVLPTFYREGVPRTILEAMAMGRPVISTDAPGCRETVEDGVNGFLVPVKNIKALAKAMERFILEPELIPRMGEAGRRIAEDKFDVNKVNKVITEIMGL